MLTLDVTIATLGPDGIARTAAMNLPRVEGVRYIVSWQIDDTNRPVPKELVREDVTVTRIPGRGVSRNRNNGLDHAAADLVLIADDDLTYTAGRLRSVIKAFEQRPEMDYAMFRYEGDDKKYYPDCECSLKRIPKGLYFTEFELCLRRRVIDGGIRYDTRFGLGQPLGVGEGDMIIHTMRRRGYDGRFIPLTITRHNGLTTGLRPTARAAVARGMGAVIGMEYPFTGLPRTVLKAIRMSRAGQMPLATALPHALEGWVRQLFMHRPWSK